MKEALRKSNAIAEEIPLSFQFAHTATGSRPAVKIPALGLDLDSDGLTGCEDPDCAGLCDPLCSTLGECDADRPFCGNATCDPLENCALCPQDCPC